MVYFLAGCLFWGSGVLALYAVRPHSRLAALTVETVQRREQVVVCAVMLVTIMLCVLPMSLSPVWNGERPGHRNQYEVMAESILEGHLYMSYDDIDPKLIEMDNPYDPELRTELGVRYRWDHAFYNGHYYMYFGVVPVFLVFLPFRMVAGAALTTYHATQIFVALFIVGVFMLFSLWAKKFFQTLSYAVYLPLSVAFSAMSVWYAIGAPALYCTAITAGLCMEIWSLFFFFKAVWDSEAERQSVIFGMLGSLFGALAFGCRPPIAMANLLAIPLFMAYIKGKKRDFKLLKQVALVALPYIVVGILLMVYNYARFENPFEFGQSYQLTRANQSGYTDIFSQFNWVNVINGVMQNFIRFSPLKETFPFITFSSVLFNFPICILALVLIFQEKTLLFLRENRLLGFSFLLMCVPVLITIMEILTTPYLLERYRMDIYWLMGLLSYLSFGIFYQTVDGNKKWYGFFLSIAAYLTVLKVFLLWTVPYDSNFTTLFPEYLDKFEKIISFGFK